MYFVLEMVIGKRTLAWCTPFSVTSKLMSLFGIIFSVSYSENVGIDIGCLCPVIGYGIASVISTCDAVVLCFGMMIS
jgi:hypothetical protein